MTDTYTPRREAARLLDAAHQFIESVPYEVTARWVFYRLLDGGFVSTKEDYRRFLGYSSKARKGLYAKWRPWTLADDTRVAVVRGEGPQTGQYWVDALANNIECYLDRWQSQPVYSEIWFEAAAMQSQFVYHANENVSLLAFRGDPSIRAKYDAVERLVARWSDLAVPIRVYYYGDLDKKGLEIPDSAVRDIKEFAWMAISRRDPGASSEDVLRYYQRFLADFHYERVGLTEDQVATYGIAENPERPGSYQWEAVPDDIAAELIGLANVELDQGAFTSITDREDVTTAEIRKHLETLRVTDQ